MASIKKIPQSNAPIKKPVLFTIEREAGDGVVSIGINGYTKQLPVGTDTVNVAAYYQNKFAIAPTTLSKLYNYKISSASALNRVANCSIELEGQSSSDIPLLYSDVNIQSDLLTTLYDRVIGWGESDEITLHDGDASVEFKSGDQSVVIENVEGLQTIVFNPHKMFPETTTMEVSVQSRDINKTIRYQIKKHKGARLAWINKFGMIDSYLFETHINTKSNIDKETIYLADGYSNVDISEEVTKTIATRYLPGETLNALSYVLKSSGVWVLQGAKWVPVDILTNSTTIHNVGKLSLLQLEYRTKTREL